MLLNGLRYSGVPDLETSVLRENGLKSGQFDFARKLEKRIKSPDSLTFDMFLRSSRKSKSETVTLLEAHY